MAGSKKGRHAGIRQSFAGMLSIKRSGALGGWRNSLFLEALISALNAHLVIKFTFG